MEYNIRIGVMEDDARVKELYQELLNTVYPNDAVPGYGDNYLDDYFDEVGEDICFIAECDGKVIGYVTVQIMRMTSGDYGYIDDISVTEEYRSKGVGSMLIARAENYITKLNINEVFLHVEQSNLKAKKLYERLGFKEYRMDGNRHCMNKLFA